MENSINELIQDIEHYFNEEDVSVGLYPIGEINQSVIEGFLDSFEGLSVMSYVKDELLLIASESLSLYVVFYNEKLNSWKCEGL